jgi:hypothetical protein
MEQLLKAPNAKVLSLETKVLSLETEVTAKDKTIMELRGKANSLEQYNRKWSIRINDLHLPHADETETKDVMQTVYDKVLLPIFQGAVSSGLLKTIPDCNSCWRRRTSCQPRATTDRSLSSPGSTPETSESWCSG